MSWSGGGGGEVIIIKVALLWPQVGTALERRRVTDSCAFCDRRVLLRRGVPRGLNARGLQLASQSLGSGGSLTCRETSFHSVNQSSPRGFSTELCLCEGKSKGLTIMSCKLYA